MYILYMYIHTCVCVCENSLCLVSIDSQIWCLTISLYALKFVGIIPKKCELELKFGDVLLCKHFYDSQIYYTYMCPSVNNAVHVICRSKHLLLQFMDCPDYKFINWSISLLLFASPTALPTTASCKFGISRGKSCSLRGIPPNITYCGEYNMQ